MVDITRHNIQCGRYRLLCHPTWQLPPATSSVVSDITRHVTQRIFNPRFCVLAVSFDVASSMCWALDSGDEAVKTGKTQDEVRRQRRMLSNRESARRSRRRKLEHVSTLEGQINMHKVGRCGLTPGSLRYNATYA